MGSGLKLIEVACYFDVDHWPGTDFPSGHRLKSGHAVGGKEGVRADWETKFQRKLTPGTFVIFLPTYSLHNRLESPCTHDSVVRT